MRGLGLRADRRVSRRAPAGRRARAAARLSGRPPSGLGVALPVSARPQRSACSRSAGLGVEQSGGAETRGRRLGRWAPRCSCAARRSTRSDSSTRSFFLYSEEIDLSRRLRRAGWETQYFPSVTVVHHESQFSAGIPERRINEMWRSRHRYWRQAPLPRWASRVAALCTGAQYAARGLLRSRDRDFAGRMWLHARDAVRVRGPGLRELAEDWNREHQAL